jgi:uncharacterized protein YecE (DUF72 family)
MQATPARGTTPERRTGAAGGGAGLEKKGTLLVGTSGYAYRHWRGVLYPPGLPQRRWLEHYASRYPTVELNATFYRLPTAAAVEGWGGRVPPSFRFACKGSRFLTHMKRLTDRGEGLRRFFDPLGRLADRLAVVLWQLPPQMDRPDAERLDVFARALPRDVRHAFEFRDEAWYVPEITRVLEAHGIALCEHDLLGPVPPQARPDVPIRYLRFHGSGVRYGGRYGEAALAPVARDLDAWRRAGRDAFVYFNNDVGGGAVHDADVLTALLAR